MTYSGVAGSTGATGQGNVRTITAAIILDLLGADNRTVVSSPDPADKTKGLVASGLVPDGKAIQVGVTSSLTSPPTFANATGVKDADGGVLPTPKDGVASGQGNLTVSPSRQVTIKVPVFGLSRNERRTQYFYENPGQVGANKGGMKPIDASKRKLCFVNAQGAPLKADGTPADDVTSAADAATTDLTAEGESVTNWAQTQRTDGSRTGVPGVYDYNPRQTALYAPYVGWTAQNTPRMDARP